jgi:hypothetical protein
VARKTIVVTIAAEGRDKGKQFFLEELPARQAERWARRALAQMINAGAHIPEGIENSGWAGLLTMGLRGLLGTSGPEVDALHDELLSCVTILPDPARPEIKRPLIAEDIEEIATLGFLKDEVFKLHANFSVRDALSMIFAAARKAISDMQNIPTSAA